MVKSLCLAISKLSVHKKTFLGSLANRQLSITKCFQDDINIDLDNIQNKINNIIKNTEIQNEHNIITFKINLHCIEDIIDNNFSIKVNKYKCNSKYIKNFINVY